MDYSFQLRFIEYLQSIRTPAWDAFFRFLNVFDTKDFYIVLLPIIWFGVNYKWGMRIFYVLFANSIINFLLKKLFMQPRPFDFASITSLVHVTNYGFPSGAAQTVILLSAILLTQWKSKWAWVLTINYVFWISLSRMYLGVHFPTDVLGGWVIGFLLFLVYQGWMEREKKILSSVSLETIIMGGVVFSILICLFFHKTVISLSAGASAGILIGSGICQHRKLLKRIPKKAKEKIGRMITVIVSLIFFHYLINFWIPFRIGGGWIQAFILGVWITVGFESFWKSIYPSKHFFDGKR